jgi:quercetin dioxygenase-like cupin family protein
MRHTYLNITAAELPQAWKSTVLSRVGGANLKVLRMDGTAYPDETHDYPEGLLVIDGQLNLTIDDKLVVVRAGELFVVPAGVAHAVAPGSAGTLMIVDI